MFLVKIKLAASTFHGIGVFANEDIKKSSVVYRHTPELDLQLTEEQFRGLDAEEQATIMHYGYQDKRTGLYRLDHDDVRFVNDAAEPTIALDAQSRDLIAVRDIQKGEELTQAYSDFETRRFIG